VNLLAANTPLPCRGLSAICRADSGQAAHVRPLDYLCLSRNVVFSPSEKPDNLVLEHLRAMRSDLGKIKKSSSIMHNSSLACGSKYTPLREIRSASRKAWHGESCALKRSKSG
jgi:hypothetical protein